MTLYSASKYAVGALTEGMRMELRGQGISTMLVCPGYVKTGFQQHVIAGQAPQPVERGRRFAITAAQCATAIRRGVERDARTVVTPRRGLDSGGPGAPVSRHRAGAHGGDERMRED